MVKDDFLSILREIIKRESGVDQNTVDRIIHDIQDTFGGDKYHIASLDRLKPRNEKIKKDYRYMTLSELSQKYDLSERQIRRIIF